MKKKSWSDKEKAAVFKSLNSFIKKGTVPGKLACENTIRNHPSLKGRSWTAVKYFVKNEVDRRKKLQKNG